MQFLKVFFIILGGIGLFTVMSGLLGVFERFIPGNRQNEIGKRLGIKNQTEDHWPLMARIGRSFSSIKQEKYKTEDDLMDSLLRAGLPYYSPAHFYGRQIAYTLLYGAFGLIVMLLFSVLINISPTVVIGTALLMGYWGSVQPQAEVTKLLKMRAEDMTIDMTYGLPRLILYLESLGEFQLATNRVLQTEHVTHLPEKEILKRQEAARLISRENALLVGATFMGFGGNLFADMLNRLASYLAQSIPVEEAIVRTKRFYPNTTKLNQFLDIVMAGVQQEIPMKTRLEEMQEVLRDELGLKVKEKAASAKQIVIVAAAAELLPLFMIVGAPTISMAVQMFG
ncbi:hypothetical protein KQH40_00905 [bacterium]|nr:hypothetical protein [bacterium]